MRWEVQKRKVQLLPTWNFWVFVMAMAGPSRDMRCLIQIWRISFYLISFVFISPLCCFFFFVLWFFFSLLFFFLLLFNLFPLCWSHLSDPFHFLFVFHFLFHLCEWWSLSATMLDLIIGFRFFFIGWWNKPNL